MATRYWVGPDGSCNFQSSANWSTTRYGAGGASISASDSLYILDGTSTIDSGLTWGVYFFLRVGRGFTGSIGTSSTPLTSNGAGSIEYAGAGSFCKISGFTTITCYSTGSGTLYVNATDFTGGDNIIIAGGNVEFAADAIGMGTASVSYSGMMVLGGSVLIAAGTGTTNIYAYGGATVVTSRNINVGVATGISTRIVTQGSCTVAAAGSESGGTFNHQSQGTITLAATNPLGKITDIGATGPFTVTNSRKSVNSEMFEIPSVTITYTNPTTHFGFP